MNALLLALSLIATAPEAKAPPAAPDPAPAPEAPWPAPEVAAAPAPLPAGPRVRFLDGPEVPLEWFVIADPSAGPRSPGGVRSDTVIAVPQGTSLVLENYAGQIEVETWGRNAVRVEALHGADDRAVARLDDGTLHVENQNRLGLPAVVNWRLTVPAWMPLRVTGVESGIAVTGTQARLQVESVRGDVSVQSCDGPLELRTVEGRLRVADTHGELSAGSVNNSIDLERVSGPIEAQTVNGDIHLHGLESLSVDASTMNGRVVFASPFRPNGRYSLQTHNGELLVGVPDGAPLDVSVALFNGQFRSSFPTPKAKSSRRGHRMRFELNSDDAPSPPPRLDLESYQGRIQLVKASELRAQLAMLRAQLARERAQLERERARMGIPRAPEPPPTPEEDHR